MGVATGNTQGDVLIAAINRIKSSAGSNPIPVIAEPQPLGPLFAEAEGEEGAQMTTGICKTCVHRSADGHCESKKFDEAGHNQTVDAIVDMLVYDYAEGGGFWVGEQFGCVHHTDRVV